MTKERVQNRWSVACQDHLVKDQVSKLVTILGLASSILDDWFEVRGSMVELPMVNEIQACLPDLERLNDGLYSYLVRFRYGLSAH